MLAIMSTDDEIHPFLSWIFTLSQVAAGLVDPAEEATFLLRFPFFYITDEHKSLNL